MFARRNYASKRRSAVNYFPRPRFVRVLFSWLDTPYPGLKYLASCHDSIYSMGVRYKPPGLTHFNPIIRIYPTYLALIAGTLVPTCLHISSSRIIVCKKFYVGRDVLTLPSL